VLPQKRDFVAQLPGFGCVLSELLRQLFRRLKNCHAMQRQLGRALRVRFILTSRECVSALTIVVRSASVNFMGFLLVFFVFRSAKFRRESSSHLAKW